MSEYLRTALLERAAALDFRPADLSAIRRAGDRRLRRRRATAAVVSSVVVALVAGVVAVLGMPRGGQHRPVVSPWPLSAVTWADGSTIHVGDETVQVGHPVAAFVRTGAGFATIDDTNDVYSVTAAGATRIGRLSQPPNHGLMGEHVAVAADPRGTLIGWVGQTQGGGAVTLQSYDQATGQARSYVVDASVGAYQAAIEAIDGRTGYWSTPMGEYAVDLDTGAQRLVARAVEYVRIYSAVQGMLAYGDRSDDATVEDIYAGRSLGSGVRLVRLGVAAYGESVSQLVQVSPTGDWVSFGVVHFVPSGGGGFSGGVTTAEVYDTRTGEHRTFDVPGQEVPLVWLDDVTVQVMGKAGEDVSVYRCTVTDGSCRRAVDLGQVTTNPGPVMPGGLASW